MSPKTADPKVRQALIEAAAKLLAEGGTKALTIRRLAGEVGTSTMAIYTHFGGMEELRGAVRREGFERLEERLSSVPRTKDPVADLSALGWAYCINAFTNPHLYRAIFLEAPGDEHELAIGRPPFEQMTEAIRRCIEDRRFEQANPEALATQLWSAAHGMSCAVLARLLSIEVIEQELPALCKKLYVGFGDDPKLAKRSLERARKRMEPAVP